MQRMMLEVTAQDLQEFLGNSSLTSEKLVNMALRQIECLDRKRPCLHAMINAVPREKVLKQAHVLDSERQQGKLSGPLHGKGSKTFAISTLPGINGSRISQL